MVKKTDLRIIKTKKAIRYAFLDLVNQKGFDSITIQDISTEAQINRATFYLHYTDKFDLLEKLSSEVLDELQTVFNPIIHYLKKEIILSDLQASIESVFTSVQHNADFYQVMFGKHGVYDFTHRMFEVVKEKFRSAFAQVGFKEEDLLVPLDLILHYNSSALIGVMNWWLGRGLTPSPHHMSAQILHIIRNGPLIAAGFKLRG